MSLLPSSLLRPGEFSSLFRLLDDYDSHRMGRLQTSAMQAFNPRFDVRESQEAYYLDGELPGIAREDLNIEFSDPQTLIVKGHTERENQAGLPAEDEAEAATNHRCWTWELNVGQFQRSFFFPSRVDQEAVKASLKMAFSLWLFPSPVVM